MFKKFRRGRKVNFMFGDIIWIYDYEKIDAIRVVFIKRNEFDESLVCKENGFPVFEKRSKNLFASREDCLNSIINILKNKSGDEKCLK